MKTARAFAPATVANVAVGFDILGFPVDVVGDEVSVTRTDESGIVIDRVEGLETALPLDPLRNCATAGLFELLRDTATPGGFRVCIKKGIPVGSGMGGSAASAVAALVAANSLLDSPLPRERLLKYAMLGEIAATGSAHTDNVSPCLFGGLILTLSADPARIVRIPVPSAIVCVLVHPHLRLDTRESRGVLKKEVLLKDHVKQSLNLAGLIAGCFQGDLALIGQSLSDVLIEPQRSKLIPGFDAVKSTMLSAGALGCSISGSGPSVFAWCAAPEVARSAGEGAVAAFKSAGVKADSWISPVGHEGVRLL